MNGYDQHSAIFARRGRPTLAEATSTDMAPSERPSRRRGAMDEAKKGGLPPWLKDKKSDDSSSSEDSGDSDSENLPPWLRDRKKGSRKGRQAESVLSPQIRPRETLERFHEAPLNAQRRNALPGPDFALPGRRYPIDTPARARAALARARVNDPSKYEQIKRAVKRRYPSMDVN